MTSEFLLDAIGQMDDELVLEAAAPTRRATPWLKAAGWAAAIVLCVGIANIPGLLSLNGASSGAAAPESDGVVDTKADDFLADYEYRSDQESLVQEPSAANKSETQSAAGTTQGVYEPKFFTQRGVYLPTVSDSGDFKQKLSPPESAVFLGKLVAAVPGQTIYPATGTDELVSCPVWESEDGQYLYIQLPDGDWITAQFVE